MEAAGSGSDVIDGTSPGSVAEHAVIPGAPKADLGTAGEAEDSRSQFLVPPSSAANESSEEQLLKIKVEEDGKVKKYKKTLRISTEAVVSERRRAEVRAVMTVSLYLGRNN